ncbi:unnamed protein product [Litomosoides sigmodontis]|uniref:Ribonuclease H2 subunit B wHTH domain-containing protein n=1 Tax=Litomosoides sigmodontis TaxID=42156 RepID=A0A3P6TDP3_LITSI|nr:unnamed protein product [Litomosoides sigmodontis]
MRVREGGMMAEVVVVNGVTGMDATSSFPKSSLSRSWLNNKCKEKKAKSDCYQRNDQSLTRFVLSNGDISAKQLHLLRHPKTGNATLYAIGNERVEELLKFDDGFRSVLLADSVISDGSLLLLVPVNPALLLLPYLQRYAKDDYVSLKDILVDDCFPSIKLLGNVKAVKSSLKHACHCKEISNIETYRYSESLMVDYIMNKITVLKKSEHYRSDFDYAIFGILKENLPDDILTLVKLDFMYERNEDAPPSKRQKKQESESWRWRDKITGTGIKRLHAAESQSAEVKCTRLRSGKVLIEKSHS